MPQNNSNNNTVEEEATCSSVVVVLLRQRDVVEAEFPFASRVSLISILNLWTAHVLLLWWGKTVHLMSFCRVFDYIGVAANATINYCIRGKFR